MYALDHVVALPYPARPQPPWGSRLNSRLRHYRWQMGLGGYWRLRDLLNLALLCFAGILAWVAYSTFPKVSEVVAIAYFLVVVLLAIDTYRDRAGKHHVQAEVLWGLFSLINDDVFKGDSRTRFTLFQRAPKKPDVIVPWYRYCRAGHGPVFETRTSRARYRKGEGLTGRAWTEAGRRVLYTPLPKFASRQAMEDYYVSPLGMDPDVVKHLSNFMVGVETILSYGFLGEGDRLLGVLSVDLQAPMSISEDGSCCSFPSPEGTKIVLDRDRLQVLLASVQRVLLAHKVATRRQL